MSYMLGSLYYHWATPKTHPTLIVAWYVPGPRDILSVRTYCSRGEGRVKHAHKCAYMHAHVHTHMHPHTNTHSTHACACTHNHICAYMQIYVHTRAYTHAYMHTKDTQRQTYA